jgi:glycerol-3-phosphate acyltransferase PlsX
MRIGIDIMGSDSSPETLFEAVAQMAAEATKLVAFVVYATSEIIRAKTNTSQSKSIGKIEWVEADSVIGMDDSPLTSIRSKKKSSLILGITHLKEGRLDAFVSAGNTGALVAASALKLKRLPGIDRPALLTVLPSEKGSVAVLDVGGNISVKSHHLIQYAHVGAIYQQCAEGIERPRVGLLNIGIESKKGPPLLRETFAALQEECGKSGSTIIFVGNVEGREVYQGNVDVLVTDGFTGNVFLKTSEGVSAFILGHLERAFSANPSPQVLEELNRIRHHVNYAEYPGAVVCGVEGVVVKCHGCSNARAMYNGIRGAIRLVDERLIDRIKDRLSGSR